MYEDYADGSHRLRHTLKADGKHIALHFKSAPSGLLSGTPAQISGVLVDNAMAVASGEEDVLMLACCTDSGEDNTLNATPELPNTFGEQRTLVLLVNFQDDPLNRPWTQAEVADVVFGQTSDFFLENSSGQTWLSGDTHGWYTTPVDSAECEINAIMEHANQAAVADGVDLASYRRIVYFHTPNGCGWAGLAMLGDNEQTTALMNGTIDPKTVGHELGHNLGLRHAHGLECGSDTLGADCQNAEYADSLDIMGARIAHFNAFHKERLGWLGSEEILTIETGGSYTLEPYAASLGTYPKTLKILKEVNPVTGQRTWYYVEYRQAIGFDSGIVTDPAFDSDNILNGVVIRTGTESDDQSSNMLDMTPGSDLIFDWFDSALTVGQSYADSEAGITITTDWADSSGASVNVALEPQAPVCVQANPTISLSPGESDWVAPGTTVDYTVTITNHDSLDCATNTFGLGATAPTFWTADFSQPVLTLGPGATATTTLAVASPSAAADGFYTIDVSASNSTDVAYATAGSATYVVSAPAEPPANNPPVALDDSVILPSKSAINIAVLANDSDPNGDSLTIITFSNGAKGTVSYNADGTLTYTPGKPFKSSDSFNYTISDGVDTASATVSITLQEPADEGGGKPGGGKGKPKK